MNRSMMMNRDAVEHVDSHTLSVDRIYSKPNFAWDSPTNFLSTLPPLPFFSISSCNIKARWLVPACFIHPIVDLWSGILCTFSSTELATLQFSSFISSRIRFWSTFHQNFHQICNYSSDEYSLIFRVGRKCIRSYGLEVYAQIQRVLLLISYFLSTVIYTSRQI